MLVRVTCIALLFGCVGFSGCGPAPVKGDINKTLTPSEPEAMLEVPAISKERTVVVDVTSSATEVDIYVIDGKEDVDKFIGASHDERPKKAIASKQLVKAGTLEAKVPANTEAKVIVYLSDKASKREKTDVTGKISSK